MKYRVIILVVNKGWNIELWIEVDINKYIV